MVIIARHYETLRWLTKSAKVYDNDVYDETSRKKTAGKQIYSFSFTIILNLGRVLNVNIHKLGWNIQDTS
jgi:hypothetical protein